MRRLSLGTAIAASLLALGGAASAAANSAKAGALPSGARDAAAAIVAQGVPGLAVRAARGGRDVVRADVGTIDPAAPLPIASASKWLTAAVVMSLVDEGKLSLDAPVSTWLRDIAPAAGAVTLRQVLAQTSGLGPGGTDIKQDYRITLAQSAKEIAGTPPATSPGSTFVYGGPGFQLAGAAVEAVTGKPWEAVFQERIAGPLAMRHSFWTHISLRETSKTAAPEVRNPTLQGGVIATADDYMHFLEMLAGRGVYKGHRVLSRAAVDAMLTDQTAGAVRTPSGVALVDSGHYALGSWCETWDGARCIRNSSLGAWGVYPWLDRDAKLYGIVFLYEANDAFRLLPHTRAIVADIVATHAPAKRR